MKIIALFLTLIGLTFLYIPNKDFGGVYLNGSDNIYIVIIDGDENISTVYKAEKIFEEKPSKTLNDYINKRAKSIIVPPSQELKEHKGIEY